MGRDDANSIEKQKISEGETTSSLSSGCFFDTLGRSSGFDQDVCDFLREEVSLKISKSVVSLVLFDGCTNMLVCSGIPIESNNTSMTRILTSEMLGTTFIARRDAGRDMKIQVHDASGNVATGWLEQNYFPNYLSRGITLVNVKQSLDVRAIHLHDEVEILPGSNLVGIELMVYRSARLRPRAHEQQNHYSRNDTKLTWVPSICRRRHLYSNNNTF